MADVSSNPGFASVAANASDMTDTIMADIDSGVPDVAPAQETAPQDSLADFGWDERPADFGDDILGDAPPSSDVVPSESEGVTATSPGSGPTPPAPAPQLDSNQQFQMAIVQQMAQMQQAFTAQLEALKPKEAPPPPADPFADMPKELRAAIDANPELKAYTEYMAKKAASPAEQFRQEIEQRIKEATHQRQVDTFRNEATSVAQKIVQSLGATGQDAKELHDLFYDQSLVLADLHGGSPAKYEKALVAALDKATNLKVAQLNSKAKASVAQRHPGSAARPQAPASTMSSKQNRTPTQADARAAGYKSLFDAALDGDAKIHQLWARQGQGQ